MHALIDLLRGPSRPGRRAGKSEAARDRFWAEGRLPANQLSVEVEGLSGLAQPLSATQAQALHKASTPARFGRREKTLLDTAVRHTGEIGADGISLSWRPGAFDALKRAVAKALGVARFDALLHNLLIYGPGQFFKPHQDTEKHPGMVATLVLVWPSPHIGGTLQVQLGQQQAAWASQHLQASELRWFAFYADCRHEVLPVQEGWRVALTFDLVLPAQAEQPAVPARLQADLQAALRQQFALDSGTPALDPWVLLLDHEYTEHGLRWPLLKGADRWRAAALRAAAEPLGLRAQLALAELHQTWSAPDTGSHRGRFADDDDLPEPDELIDESLSLDFWVDENDEVGPRNGLSMSPAHTASFVDTGDEHLVRQEYEGYMGNYGETLDHWYRRAALVIQSPLAAERARFELDFDAALRDAVRLAKDPASSEVLAVLVRVAARALADQAATRGRVLLDAYAKIAAVLPEAEATALMGGFDASTWVPKDAAVLARLERQRGTPWMRALLQSWQAHDRGAGLAWRPGWGTTLAIPRLWPTPLPAFTQAAGAAGWSRELLDDWFSACSAALSRFDQACLKAVPAHRMQLLPGLLLAVDELGQALSLRGPDGEAALKALIDQLLAQPVLYPSERLAAVARSAGAVADRWPRRRPLRRQVVEALRAALAKPERALTDQGLRDIEWTCRCKDCTGMIGWAESPAAEPLVMAMAEQRRQHVQGRIEAAGAPLTAATLKQGTPYKLVLHKPRDLLEQDRTERRRQAQDLQIVQG